MGAPLRVGTRAEKYPRTANHKKFEENLAEISFPPKDPDRPKRVKMVFRGGKMVTLVADGKQLAEAPAYRDAAVRGAAPDAYSVLKHSMDGYDPASRVSRTTAAEVAHAGGFTPPERRD